MIRYILWYKTTCQAKILIGQKNLQNYFKTEEVLQKKVHFLFKNFKLRQIAMHLSSSRQVIFVGLVICGRRHSMHSPLDTR